MYKQIGKTSLITLFFALLIEIFFIAIPDVVYAEEPKGLCEMERGLCMIDTGDANKKSPAECDQVYQECVNTYSNTQNPAPAQQNEQQVPQPSATNNTPQTIPQQMTEKAWLDSLGLDLDQLVELSQGQNKITPFYQSPQQREIVGLTATSLTLHDQLAKDYDSLSNAKQNNASSTEIDKIKSTMNTDRTGYKQSLESLLMANPKDPTANYEMGNVYFNEGTVDSFVAARNLHFRAYMNLDQQDRTNLQTQVQQSIERNGFEKAFNQPTPQSSSFLGAMNGELDSKLSGIKNVAKDWLKQSVIYSQAETYSNTVRQTISDVTDNIFKVDNKSINQATYGQ